MKDLKLFLIINDVKVLNSKCAFTLFQVHIETITGFSRIVICHDFDEFYCFLIELFYYLDYDFTSFGYLNEFGIEITVDDLKKKFKYS